MTAQVLQLPTPAALAPRYPDTVDLREVMRQGEQMLHPIAYSHDTWDLAGCPDIGTKRSNVLFGGIPARYRPLVKDFFLLRGSPDLATAWAPDLDLAARHAQTRTTWGNTRGKVKRVVSLLRLMDGLGMRELDGRDWNELAREMLETERIHSHTGEPLTWSPDSAVRAAHVLREIDELAPIMGRPSPFGSRPWGTDELNNLFGYRQPKVGERRNQTEPVGDVFAMAGACLNLLRRCSDDIIDRIDWWRTRTEATSAPAGQPGDVWAHAMDTWAGTGCPLPLRPSRGRAGSSIEAHEAVLLHDGHDSPTKISPSDFATTRHHAWADAADPDCDPYLAAHPEAEQPTWLATGEHLLPVNPTAGGLYWWANQLVIAAYYAVAAITTLRGREMDALKPDCITKSESGRWTMTGRKVKNTDLTAEAETIWYVNDHVANAIDIINRLREALDAETLHHPRIADSPVLFANNLINRENDVDMKDALLPRPLLGDHQRRTIIPALTKLYEAGVGEAVADLKVVNHTTVRQTALDAYVDRPLGDLAAIAMAKWTTLTVAYGYMGHRPKIITPAFPDEVAEHRIKRGEITRIAMDAVDDPGSLGGSGTAKLVDKVQSEPKLLDGVVSVSVLAARFRKGAIKTLSVGPLAACASPEGGLCGGIVEANHRLCQLGCRNMILTPYDRARLEVQRRGTIAQLGKNAHLVAKLDRHADELAEEREMTDEELIAILTDRWDPKFVTLLDNLLEAAA